MYATRLSRDGSVWSVSEGGKGSMDFEYSSGTIKSVYVFSRQCLV
jgi:hypothetical protein